MIELKTFRSPSSIKSEWESIQKNNLLSPFQRYDFVKTVHKYGWYYFLMNKCKPYYYLFMDNGKPICIVPTLKYADGRVELFAHLNGIEYNDCIYTDEIKLKECMMILFKAEPDFSAAYWVKDNSPLSNVIKESGGFSTTHQENVGISFDTYQTWFSSLSKNVRQNLRTAHNRAEKSGINVSYLIIRGNGQISGDYPFKNNSLNRFFVWNKIMKLYRSRHDQRYNLKSGFIQNILLRYHHYLTSNFINNDSALTFILYLNDEIAAFASGLVHNSAFIIPRLSVNTSLLRFSPGYMLINKMVDTFAHSGGINYLDLGHGQEKYKTDLGGEVFYSNIFHKNDLSQIY